MSKKYIMIGAAVVIAYLLIQNGYLGNIADLWTTPSDS
jgi:hypothetical protein